MKRLRGFKKVKLNPNESTTIKLSIPIKELAFVGKENEWIVEAGEHTLSIKSLKTNFEITEPDLKE